VFRWNAVLLATGATTASLMLLGAPGWAGGSGMCMTVTVPEPASGALLAVGVAGILWYRARRNRK